MAKNVKLNKSPEQYDIEETYMRLRRNLQANIRSLRKRGYNIPENYVPEIPKRITEASIRNIQRLNQKRYEKATKIVQNYEDKDEARISGTSALILERREAALKARNTKYTNEGKRKDKVLFAQLVNEGYDPRDAYKIINNQAESEEFSGKFVDLDTGEIINNLKPENVRVMPLDSFSEAIYNNLMGELDRLTEYEGTDKHAKDTRVNAQQIKNYIKQMENSKRKEVLLALNHMFDEGQLLSPQMYYRTGGYNDFIYKLGQAIDYVEVVQAYGEDADYGAYSTYEDAED